MSLEYNVNKTSFLTTLLVYKFEVREVCETEFQFEPSSFKFESYQPVRFWMSFSPLTIPVYIQNKTHVNSC